MTQITPFIQRYRSKYKKHGMLDKCTHIPLQDKLHKRLTRYWFWSDGIQQTQESIDLLSEPDAIRTPIWKIGRKIHKPGRFDFWRMVFENRERIPKDELLTVWYDCLRDTANPYHTKVETPDDIDNFKFRLDKPKGYKLSTSEMKAIKAERNAKLATSVITNPLLIDNLTVRYRYCLVKKKGWEMLRRVEGGLMVNLNLPNSMRQAIRDDDIPAFCLNLNLCGKSISVSLLEEIMRYGGPKIFSYLVEENMIKPCVFPLPELCCFIVTHFDDTKSVPLLMALKKHSQGLLKSVKDDFGRNLLWYAIYNLNTAWFHPNCKLTSFLLENGCDPTNKNHLGMSWQFVTDNLTVQQKTYLLKMRYKYYTDEFGLRTTQPIESILEQNK